MTSGIILISVLQPAEHQGYLPFCYRYWAPGSPLDGEYPTPEWQKPTHRGYVWKSG